MERNKRQFKKQLQKKLTARKNQNDRKIYTLGGEIFSSITHGIAAAASLVILLICIYVAFENDLGWLSIISVSIFGAFAFAGFTISTVYHALAVNSGKRVMRTLDYCSIYFIIAGTYTPFCIIAIGGWVGWSLLAANWILCIIGTTLSAVNRTKFKTFSFICYLTMGWLALTAIVPIINTIGFGASFWFIFGGGVAYTAGAFVFKLKGKYTHGIWHIFTFAGLVLHFLSIYFLIT